MDFTLGPLFIYIYKLNMYMYTYISLLCPVPFFLMLKKEGLHVCVCVFEEFIYSCLC